MPVGTMADTMSYARPPITEAVLELRFAQSYSREITEKAAARLKREYAHSEHDEGVDVNVDVGARKSEFETSFTGIRMSSSDRADVTIFRTNSFVSSRLAPYSGWEPYMQRARRDWEVWRKAAGVPKLARIGVRYINRLDIPLGEHAKVDARDYLTVWPHMPELDWEPILTFAMQAVRPLGVDECAARIFTGSIESPLIGHVGLVLDLDIFRESALPMRDDELWDLINRIRVHKNRLFESCITDRARELFR